MIIAFVTPNLMYVEEDIMYLRFKNREKFIDIIGTILSHKLLYLIKIVEIKE